MMLTSQAKDALPAVAAQGGGNLALLSMLGALLLTHPNKLELEAVWTLVKEDTLSKLLHSGMPDETIKGFEEFAEILEKRLRGGFVSVDLGAGKDGGANG